MARYQVHKHSRSSVNKPQIQIQVATAVPAVVNIVAHMPSALLRPWISAAQAVKMDGLEALKVLGFAYCAAVEEMGGNKIWLYFVQWYREFG